MKIKIVCDKNGFPAKNIKPVGLELLKKQSWTGNVRELRNFVERLLIMVPGDEIGDSDIRQYLSGNNSKQDELLNISNSFQEFKENAEKAFISKQLDANSWNISKTAEILGIQRSHLYGKMKKYNIEKDG